METPLRVAVEPALMPFDAIVTAATLERDDAETGMLNVRIGKHLPLTHTDVCPYVEDP